MIKLLLEFCYLSFVNSTSQHLDIVMWHLVHVSDCVGAAVATFCLKTLPAGTSLLVVCTQNDCWRKPIMCRGGASDLYLVLGRSASLKSRSLIQRRRHLQRTQEILDTQPSWWLSMLFGS